jgi:hypothetical protein
MNRDIAAARRDIKFRAWLPEHDSDMIYDYGSFKDERTLGEFAGWNPINGYVMQYTGLKDAAGVDIYEGDIINGVMWMDCLGIRVHFTSPVKFSNGGFTVDDEFLGGDNIYGKYKVLGNIYENPELVQEI